MDNSSDLLGEFVAEATLSVPVGLVPTPTQEYRTRRKAQKMFQQPGKPNAATDLPVPIPIPLLQGPRVLIYKQDPSVQEIGLRRVFLPRFVQNGPKDSRINSAGLPVVSANSFGDFIQTPNTDSFDAVQAFAVVRMTLTMVQRALAATGNPVPWQWNSPANTTPLAVHAHGLPDTMNAFYSRNEKALKFGDFNRPGTTPPQRVFTCRSLDIVSHEAGHAILDGLKPGWLQGGNPPQTGGLHESFGDLMAIFLTLSQLDQVEAIIVQTKSNLHDKTFLSDMAEEFGLALGRPNGLRNADNDLKLSQVGAEVHAISQVFTGAIYDILADIFAFERNVSRINDATVLCDSGQYLLSVVLRALIASPAVGATFANVANLMINVVTSDGKPVAYRNFIRNRFTVREVITTAVALTVDADKETLYDADIVDKPGAVQDRSTCCGTMKLTDYFEDDIIEDELKAFTKALKKMESVTIKKQANGLEPVTPNNGPKEN